MELGEPNPLSLTHCSPEKGIEYKNFNELLTAGYLRVKREG